MEAPTYIKVSTKAYDNLWAEHNQKALQILKSIGKELENHTASTYLIGSAAGRERAENVNDLDVLVFVNDATDLIKVEETTRKYKRIESSELKVRFQFYLSALITDFFPTANMDTAYFASIKATNLHLGGQDLLNQAAWPDEEQLSETAKANLISAALMVFRIANKQRFAEKEAAGLFREIKKIIFNAMFLKGYFGFSKRELFDLFLSEYKVKNELPAKIALEGRENFTQYNHEELFDACLKFSAELLELITHKK